MAKVEDVDVAAVGSHDHDRVGRAARKRGIVGEGDMPAVG